jgi:hypothetical protein
MGKIIINEMTYQEMIYQEMIVDNTLEIGDNMKVSLKNRDNLTVMAGNYNDITVGENCNIICGKENKVECGKNCMIYSGDKNKITIKSNSKAFIGEDCEIKLKGKKILLEINGKNAEIYNKSKNSGIITYNEKGKMKLYKTKKLKKGVVTVENGEFSLDYDNRYITIGK